MTLEAIRKAKEKQPKLFAYLDGVPEYLWPLLEFTPRSLDKLRSAWNDLGLESQIQIALVLPRLGDLPAEYYTEPLCDIVATSRHELVRYLGVRLGGRPEDPNSDPSPLVRSAKQEIRPDLVSASAAGCPGSSLMADSVTADELREFWNLDRDSRLAHIARCVDNDGVAVLVRRSREAGLADDEQIHELLAEYVLRPGYRALNGAYDVGLLWQLIPELPEKTGVLLAHALPIVLYGEELEGLSPSLRHVVFSRVDVQLGHARKEFFWDLLQNGDGHPWGLFLHQVAERSMTIDVDDFSKIRALSDPEKKEITLGALSCARDLPLWAYEAVEDEFSALKEQEQDVCYDYRDIRGQIAGRRLRAYEPGAWDLDLRMRQLYLLARRSVENGEASSDSFTRAYYVKESIWDTFLSFRGEASPIVAPTNRHLPTPDHWPDPDLEEEQQTPRWVVPTAKPKKRPLDVLATRLNTLTVLVGLLVPATLVLLILTVWILVRTPSGLP